MKKTENKTEKKTKNQLATKAAKLTDRLDHMVPD
jgi:hypothetical protein